MVMKESFNLNNMDKNYIKNFAKKVLEDGFVLSLGTQDRDGVWVADLIYVHDQDLNLYWISMPEARHSRALGQNKMVACTITASHYTNQERALQVEGVAEKIDGPMFELEKKLETKRGLPVPQKAGEILEKGHVWYKLIPTKIYLIHSVPFGYERQNVEID